MEATAQTSRLFVGEEVKPVAIDVNDVLQKAVEEYKDPDSQRKFYDTLPKGERDKIMPDGVFGRAATESWLTKKLPKDSPLLKNGTPQKIAHDFIDSLKAAGHSPSKNKEMDVDAVLRTFVKEKYGIDPAEGNDQERSIKDMLQDKKTSAREKLTGLRDRLKSKKSEELSQEDKDRAGELTSVTAQIDMALSTADRLTTPESTEDSLNFLKEYVQAHPDQAEALAAKLHQELKDDPDKDSDDPSYAFRYAALKNIGKWATVEKSEEEELEDLNKIAKDLKKNPPTMDNSAVKTSPLDKLRDFIARRRKGQSEEAILKDLEKTTKDLEQNPPHMDMSIARPPIDEPASESPYIDDGGHPEADAAQNNFYDLLDTTIAATKNDEDVTELGQKIDDLLHAYPEIAAKNVNTLRELADIHPNNLGFHRALMNAYDKSGQKDKAQEEFKTVTRLSSAHSVEADPLAEQPTTEPIADTIDKKTAKLIDDLEKNPPVADDLLPEEAEGAAQLKTTVEDLHANPPAVDDSLPQDNPSQEPNPLATDLAADTLDRVAAENKRQADNKAAEQAARKAQREADDAAWAAASHANLDDLNGHRMKSIEELTDPLTFKYGRPQAHEPVEGAASEWGLPTTQEGQPDNLATDEAARLEDALVATDTLSPEDEADWLSYLQGDSAEQASETEPAQAQQSPEPVMAEGAYTRFTPDTSRPTIREGEADALDTDEAARLEDAWAATEASEPTPEELSEWYDSLELFDQLEGLPTGEEPKTEPAAPVEPSPTPAEEPTPAEAAPSQADEVVDAVDAVNQIARSESAAPPTNQQTESLAAVADEFIDTERPDASEISPMPPVVDTVASDTTIAPTESPPVNTASPTPTEQPALRTETASSNGSTPRRPERRPHWRTQTVTVTPIPEGAAEGAIETAIRNRGITVEDPRMAALMEEFLAAKGDEKKLVEIRERAKEMGFDESSLSVEAQRTEAPAKAVESALNISIETPVVTEQLRPAREALSQGEIGKALELYRQQDYLDLDLHEAIERDLQGAMNKYPSKPDIVWALQTFYNLSGKRKEAGALDERLNESQRLSIEDQRRVQDAYLATYAEEPINVDEQLEQDYYNYYAEPAISTQEAIDTKAAISEAEPALISGSQPVEAVATLPQEEAPKEPVKPAAESSTQSVAAEIETPQFTENVQQIINRFNEGSKFSSFNVADEIIREHPEQLGDVIKAIDYIISQLSEENDIMMFEGYKKELQAKQQATTPAEQPPVEAPAQPVAAETPEPQPTIEPSSPAGRDLQAAMDSLSRESGPQKDAAPRQGWGARLRNLLGRSKPTVQAAPAPVQPPAQPTPAEYPSRHPVSKLKANLDLLP